MDPFQKVHRGAPLRIPAETFNTFLDAALDYRRRTRNQSRQRQPQFRQSGIILVQNGTGQDLDRYAVLGLSRPLILPTENLWAFRDQVVFVGTVPSPALLGRFAVLQEPLPAGRIGPAVLSGVTPVRLLVDRPEHPYADIEPLQSGRLLSTDRGGAFVLWREPVPADSSPPPPPDGSDAGNGGGGGSYGGYGYGYGYTDYGGRDYGGDDEPEDDDEPRPRTEVWAVVRLGNIAPPPPDDWGEL